MIIIATVFGTQTVAIGAGINIRRGIKPCGLDLLDRRVADVVIKKVATAP